MNDRPAPPPRVLRAATAALVVAAAAYLVLFKAGRLPVRPGVFAALCGVATAGLLACTVEALRRAWRGPARAPAVGEALVAGGLLLVLGGGLANWLLSHEGFVAVAERDPVRLDRAADLGAYEAGPLSSRRELAVTVALARLQLAAVGPGRFKVVSQLRLLEDGGDEVGLAVERGKVARYKTLVFHQGAFGFAPRVVIARGGEKLLDEYVPFRTIREGPDGIAFVGDFEISREKLSVSGAVSLDDLNDDMKGHPRLELTVTRDGAPVGQGSLKPGEFAELSGGYRVGFTALRRWSEIDFSRRTYRAPMLAGAVAFALGALLWPVAAWRARRRSIAL